LLNVYGNQKVDVSTVRQWVVCFSSADNEIKTSHFLVRQEDFDERGMQAFVHCWQICRANGDYV